MVSIYEAVILGLVQGITEWLPISSSGHLVIMQHYLGIQEPMVMGLVLHVASLLVVFYVFFDEILNILKGLYFYFRGDQNFFDDKYRKLGFMVIVATIPTVIIGLLFRDLIESAFSSLLFVGMGLLLTSVLLYLTHLVDKKLSNFKDESRMKYRDALIIGLFQGVAIFPGVSRSGSTIASGLLVGLDKNLAATFSFLLFIPAILGAVVLELGEISFDKLDLLPVLVSSLVTIVISYVFIKFLLHVVRKGRLYLFSVYCLILGIVIIVISL